MGDPRRRALSAVGGPVRSDGDPGAARLLAGAFRAAEGDDPDRLTHGFHSYPARMHPAIARALVTGFATDGIVLDPFAGSGTVLLEAMIAGRASVGVDLNPLALRVAEVKCDRRDAASRAAFLERLAAIAERSEERVRARVDARAPLSKQEARWYEPHVLKELAGLREEILAVDDERDRRALEVLLASIVVKFSRQRADTSAVASNKRIRKGLVTEFFARKGRELVARWEALDTALPSQAPAPRFVEGDALRLRTLLGARFRASCVITSPPYGGTYDYVTHHARRYPWLGLDARRLERFELGARRHLRGEDAVARWDTQMLGALRAIANVTSPGASVILLTGDAHLGRRRVPADEQLARLAPGADLDPVAVASQRRPDWNGAGHREEHLVLLRRR